MLMQRAPHQLARRALTQPSPFSKSLSPILRIAPSLALQARTAAFAPASSPPKTKPSTPSSAYEILAAQRLRRPISPHLTIYRPQVTWYLSALNRITGSVLSGGLYLFAAAYCVSPLTGWHLESAAMAEAFGSLGPVTKFGIKYLIAMPFTFHSFNGIRHLIWDTGREFHNVTVMRTGWFVVGLSVVTSGILAYM